jgi:hypothetical protein
MYMLGLLKSPLVSPTKKIQEGEFLDTLAYLRFTMNNIGPEEMLALFHPQILSISNKNLNDQEFPAMEALYGASI